MLFNPKYKSFHLTYLIKAGLVEPGKGVLHRGEAVRRVGHFVVHVVVDGGGGGEAVRGADRVGGALGGQARHRPQPDHHGVRLLERPQRVSDLRKLFSPEKILSVTSFLLDIWLLDIRLNLIFDCCNISYLYPFLLVFLAAAVEALTAFDASLLFGTWLALGGLAGLQIFSVVSKYFSVKIF